MNPITKQQAKKALGIATDAGLARHFGIDRRAVYQWPENDAMPVQRQWELRATRPDLFPVRGAKRRSPTASLPNNALPIGVPNGEHPVRDANNRDHVLGAGRSK